MVNWLGIEDVSAVPTRVWLSREKDTDEWKPLRKVDCRALNQRRLELETSSTSMDSETPSSDSNKLFIEYGRATADLKTHQISYNYYPAPNQQLTSATWFLKKEDPQDKTQTILVPMDDIQAIAVEDLYQNAVQASSSMGNGLEGLLKEHVPLSEDSHVAVVKAEGNHYCLRKQPNGWFGGKSFDLQRGYGAYTVPGEDEEAQLNPVQHLFFVVHGIGEAMWSREDFTMAGSLIQEIDNYRLKMQKQQIVEWKQDCERAKRSKMPLPEPPHRVELIPILWYDSIHSSSSALMKTLKATTLTTIPALREIANDVIFDVLMYMTPNFCYDVLECVTEKIHKVHDQFLVNNPNFLANKGQFSLMGHSLGSVICWDLLSVLHDHRQMLDSHKDASDEEAFVHISSDGFSSDIGYQSYASKENVDQEKSGNFGPSLPKPLERALPFEPQHTVFLGSPIGLFLTLRGAHPIFDAIRDKLPDGPGKPRASPFRLPTKSVHNIFHPSDPVAYRIEPLLLAQGTQELPPPEYVTREGADVRLHVKARQLGGQIAKSIMGKRKTLSSFMSVVSDQAQNYLQQLDERNAKLEANQDKHMEGSPMDQQGPLRFPLAGRKGRIDYQLQPNVIDNEYVSAVLAHSSYFANTDVIEYTIDLIQTKKEVSDVIDLTMSDA